MKWCLSLFSDLSNFAGEFVWDQLKNNSRRLIASLKSSATGPHHRESCFAGYTSSFMKQQISRVYVKAHITRKAFQSAQLVLANDLPPIKEH